MQEFEQNIYTILSYLESGKLTTYGELAKQAGFPHHSRHVGKVLSKLPKDTRLPWHRVVNAQGKISMIGDRFLAQKKRLESEGITVNSDGKIMNFKRILIPK